MFSRLKNFFWIGFIFEILLICSCENSSNLPINPLVLNTSSVSNIAYDYAICSGTIQSDGGFKISERGVCWNTAPNPIVSNNKIIDSSGAQVFTCVLSGLSQSTIYYVRAYAINEKGVAYGIQQNFTTQTGNQIDRPLDFDGNVYRTVTIGSQVWMMDNLKTTHYSNGDPIQNITDNTAWAIAGAAYCNYNNSENNSTIYGRLYNWQAVIDSRKIAPKGWHLATDIEWFQLVQFLGSSSNAGGKLKEYGTFHWQSPNSSATNQSGFTGLPCGWRSDTGAFSNLGTYGYWWSSGGWSGITSWQLRYNNSDCQITSFQQKCGLSLRCVRD